MGVAGRRVWSTSSVVWNSSARPSITTAIAREKHCGPDDNSDDAARPSDGTGLDARSTAGGDTKLTRTATWTSATGLSTRLAVVMGRHSAFRGSSREACPWVTTQARTWVSQAWTHLGGVSHSWSAAMNSHATGPPSPVNGQVPAALRVVSLSPWNGRVAVVGSTQSGMAS